MRGVLQSLIGILVDCNSLGGRIDAVESGVLQSLIGILVDCNLNFRGCSGTTLELQSLIGILVDCNYITIAIKTCLMHTTLELQSLIGILVDCNCLASVSWYLQLNLQSLIGILVDCNSLEALYQPCRFSFNP